MRVPLFRLQCGKRRLRASLNHADPILQGSTTTIGVRLALCIALYHACTKQPKGKVGSASAAAKYAAATPAEGFSISEAKPYAEVRPPLPGGM